MVRALAESASVLGRTSPNPPVGAVILDKSGQVVGAGATRPPPGPHAEVIALAQAGARARGGTAVITLEPCAHTGRTPPCTRALLAAGIARVAVGVADPDPVAAGGASVLRAAGVAVEMGVQAAAVEAGPLRAWLHRTRRGRPFVTLKTAATLDGRVAAADGTSRWITSQAARRDVHRLRSEVDAIVVGTGTALADDPALTVRRPPAQPGPAHQPAPQRQPLRVVVGLRELPATARLHDQSRAPTLLLPTHDPREVLAQLAAREVVSVLLEGGPTLGGVFVAAGLVDRVVAYLAPALLGAGPAALGPAGVGTIAGIHRLRVEDLTMVGADVRIVAASDLPASDLPAPDLPAPNPDGPGAPFTER